MKRLLFFLVFVIGTLTVFSNRYSWDSKQEEVEKKEGSIALASDCSMADSEIQLVELGSTSVQFSWKDDLHSKWELFVQMPSSSAPTTSGVMVSKNSVSIDRLTGTTTLLLPDTDYYFYIRAVCGTDKGDWHGPYWFKTSCDTAITPPFSEGFNTNSTLSCWRSLQENQIIAIPNSTWTTTTTKQEGDQAITASSNVKEKENWLFSPSIMLRDKVRYRLTYYYRTTYAKITEVTVKLAENTLAPKNFTQVIVGNKKVKEGVFQKETAFILGTGKPVFIGWELKGEKGIDFYLDDVRLEEVVDCTEPLALNSKDHLANQVTITWEDAINTTSWEYFVQKQGGKTPTSTDKGTTSTKKEAPVTTEQGGTVLLPNTAYEFYVRTLCQGGGSSIWAGPYVFRTACAIPAIPFWEGFNGPSKTVDCWTMLDVNDDATSPTGSNLWRVYNSTAFEGDRSVYFYGADGIKHDDWLISPVFTFDKNKVYRLKYHYQTSAFDSNVFEVKASNQGMDPSKFTTTVVEKKTYKNATYVEEIAFIQGLSGSVQLGWHVLSEGTTSVWIDNVFVEEVLNCAEPLGLGVQDVEATKTTLTWKDNINTNGWEYVVQPKGQGIPTTAGTTTKVKAEVVSQTYAGTALLPNTEYEFYVRTSCGNGTYSIWSGPFVFYTACETYKAPFKEGFNTTSPSLRCWDIVDANGDKDFMGNNAWRPYNIGHFEGDQSMYYFALDPMNQAKHDDWLISPEIEMDGGTYVLKYYYKTVNVPIFDCQFEVLLSNSGTNAADFTTTIVPLKSYKVENYIEEVAFISGVKGKVNISWHVKGTGTSFIYLDRVSIEKSENCKEPYYVTVTDFTTTTVDLNWKQDDGLTQWEVIVVGFGEDPDAPNGKTYTVTGSPDTVLTNLDAGKGYTIYVRAICTGGTSKSNWSTPVNVGTKVGANDVCAGALVIPINKGLTCTAKTAASFLNATASSMPNPTCFPGAAKTDIWFSFVAEASAHFLDLSNRTSLSFREFPSLEVALYEADDCTKITTTAKLCFTLEKGVYNQMLSKLQIGKRYYIRIMTTASKPDFIFNLCLTTSEHTGIEVSPSGDKYTVEELISDVFIDADCNLVSNVKYQAGDKSKINTFGYFAKQGADFPFDEGIVLATHNVTTTAGPYDPAAEKEKVPAWIGDADLNKVIAAVGGASFGDEKYVSVVEFDFIPVKDSIQFEYLFASESYHKDCGVVCNSGGALFAAWLTEISSNTGENLALVPGTEDPIALSTIRDSKKTGARCESINPTFFDKAFGFDKQQTHPLDAPINYAGITKAMQSEKVAVKPGYKYHIKLAIADFCDTPSHTSAVFFNARSFDVGQLDLGADLTVENGSALCAGTTKVLRASVSEDIATVQWFKDGVSLGGKTDSTLEIKEAGTYRVEVKYPEIDCIVVGEIKVDYLPAIESLVEQPKDLEICRYTSGEARVDLTQVERGGMFSKEDRNKYAVTYYKTKQEALDQHEGIETPTQFVVDPTSTQQHLVVRVEDQVTGCFGVFEFKVIKVAGDRPVKPQDVTACESYILPSVKENQFYYTQAGGKGTKYQAGDQLTVGTHEMYLFQDNGAGCFEEVPFTIKVTEKNIAAVFPDVTLECELYILQPLPKGQQYFITVNGVRIEVAEGTTITENETKVTIVAESEDGVCLDESSFTVYYNECPIPKGFSPNGDGVNDAFDLSKHGATDVKVFNRNGVEVYSFKGAYTNQWDGRSKGGDYLPSGTYYYVIKAFDKTRTGWVQINR